VETEDTASAPGISEHRSKHIAAICQYDGCDLFGLDVLAPVSRHEEYYTRFLILQREDRAEVVADSDKASVISYDHSGEAWRRGC